jgi:NAD+ synthase (glutamine-hydrolysing)
MRFKIGIAQFAPRLGDTAANLQRILELAEEARGRGVDLLLFSELALTGYTVQDLVPEVALQRDAPELAALARASKSISLLVGFVEESEDYRFFNSAAYFEKGKRVAVHRKIYPPTYGMFDEEREFARGETLRSFPTRFGRAGILICEDFWHLSLPYLLAQDGAHMILAPSASPGRGLTGTGDSEVFPVMEFIPSMGRVWAKLLNVYFLFAHRVGFEDGVNFWGGSEVIGPDGASQGRAPYFDEHLLVVDADTEAVRRERMSAGQFRDEDADLVVRELGRILSARRGLAAPAAGGDGSLPVAPPRRSRAGKTAGKTKKRATTKVRASTRAKTRARTAKRAAGAGRGAARPARSSRRGGNR